MKKISKYIKYLLFAIIGIGLLIYIFRAQSISNIVSLISNSNVYLLFLASAVFFITHIFRALRWKILIEPFNVLPSTINLYNAIIASLLVNVFLTRVGEIYRCIVINKSNNIATSKLIGTVVTERIIDLLSLFVISIVVIATNYAISKQYISIHLFNNLQWNNLLYITLVICLFLIILIVAAKYLYKYYCNNYIFVKIKNFIKDLYKGVLSITKIKQKLMFFVYTTIIWICYWLFTYIITLAFPATHSLPSTTSLVILVLSGVAMALPIQSGIGAFHILVTNILLLYNIPIDKALAYATLAHGLPLVTVIILGSIAFLSIYLKLRKHRKYAQVRYSTK